MDRLNKRVITMLENAGVASQHAPLCDDKVVVEALVRNIIQPAFLAGIEAGRASEANETFLTRLFTFDADRETHKEKTDGH